MVLDLAYGLTDSHVTTKLFQVDGLPRVGLPSPVQGSARTSIPSGYQPWFWMHRGSHFSLASKGFSLLLLRGVSETSIYSSITVDTAAHLDNTALATCAGVAISQGFFNDLESWNNEWSRTKRRSTRQGKRTVKQSLFFVPFRWTNKAFGEIWNE